LSISRQLYEATAYETANSVKVWPSGRARVNVSLLLSCNVPVETS